MCAGALSHDWMNFRKLLAPSIVGASPAPTGIQRKLSNPYLAKSYITASRLTMVLTPCPRNHRHWLSSAGVSEAVSRPAQMTSNPATGAPSSSGAPAAVAAIMLPASACHRPRLSSTSRAKAGPVGAAVLPDSAANVADAGADANGI